MRACISDLLRSMAGMPLERMALEGCWRSFSSMEGGSKEAVAVSEGAAAVPCMLPSP